MSEVMWFWVGFLGAIPTACVAVTVRDWRRHRSLVRKWRLAGSMHRHPAGKGRR